MLNFKTKIMKKITATTTIVTFFALLFLFMGCKKTKDYREQWVGEWDFVIASHKFNVDSIYQDVRDTLYNIGNIGLGNGKNELIIKCLEDYYLMPIMPIMQVDINGKLSFYKSGHYYAEGQFAGKDLVHIFYHNGGLGGWLDLTINGKKKGGGNE